MLYVDCKVLGSREFEISWGWPLSNAREHSPAAQGGAVVETVDKRIKHAVIEYMGNMGMEKIEWKTSPYIYNGKLMQLLIFSTRNTNNTPKNITK